MPKLPLSGKKYNFFIDDNIFFFNDIYEHCHVSIFDQFYLNGLKKAHLKYGTKFTLNCFWKNSHNPSFDLSQFPDKYRSEFEDNSDWLRFAFHGYAEFPDRPYSEAYPEKMPEHYALLMNDLRRIVGGKSLIAPVIMHWFRITPENRIFMRKHGMKFFAVPEGEEITCNRDFSMYDMPVDAILNLFKDDLRGIEERLNRRIASGKNLICIGSHEQYAYRDYSNYIPQYFEEIDTALRIMADNGYESVYFNEL